MHSLPNNSITVIFLLRVEHSLVGLMKTAFNFIETQDGLLDETTISATNTLLI
jgi:hypothetical protein